MIARGVDMLHIVLTIIKFVGILFLCLLCLFVLLGCALIFVPVHYEAKGSYLEKIEGKIRFSWFLRFFSLQASYAGEKTTLIIKICGIPLRRKKQKSEKKQKKTRRDIKHEKTEQEKSETPQKQERDIFLDREEEKGNTEGKKDLSGDECSEKESQKDREVFQEFEGKQEQKKFKINLFEKIKQTIKKIKESIKTLQKTKEKIKSFLEENDIKAIFGLCKSQVLILFKHFRPRKLILNLRFGFEDPSITGMVLGVLCVLYPFYRNTINIKPDFENKVLEGDFYCKGRIRFFHMLAIGCRMWRDKNFRKMIKNFIKIGGK